MELGSFKNKDSTHDLQLMCIVLSPEGILNISLNIYILICQEFEEV